MLIYFNFSLLLLYFKDVFVILPFFTYLFFFWIFFMKNNFFTVSMNPGSLDKILNSNVLKKIHYTFTMNWMSSNLIYFLFFIFFLKSDFNVFWFNHLKINNFNLNIMIVILLMSFFSLNMTKYMKNSNVNYNMDYFSSMLNLIIFVPLMFLSNTMFTFLFVLESISLIILYKFTVSSNWFNNKNKTFNSILPKAYLNMIFFQYWANFFSSMFMMFSLFSLIFFYGSVDWKFLELSNSINNNNMYFYNNYMFMYIWMIFFMGFFLKMGLTPLHLFKMEVYKGMPFMSIFFYTTWYFLSFFIFFSMLIFNDLNSLKNLFNIMFFMIMIFGLFYSMNLLFDVNLMKSFFAYSTIVNVTNFIMVLFLINN